MTMTKALIYGKGAIGSFAGYLLSERAETAKSRNDCSSMGPDIEIKLGSSLFRGGNLRIPIREVHHVIAFLGFDQPAIDSDSQFESERFSGVMAWFDPIDRLNSQTHSFRTARNLLKYCRESIFMRLAAGGSSE